VLYIETKREIRIVFFVSDMNIEEHSKNYFDSLRWMDVDILGYPGVIPLATSTPGTVS